MSDLLENPPDLALYISPSIKASKAVRLLVLFSNRGTLVFDLDESEGLAVMNECWAITEGFGERRGLGDKAGFGRSGGLLREGMLDLAAGVKHSDGAEAAVEY